MNRLSKLVAVLALSGVVTTATPMPCAHSACMPASKPLGRECHSMTVEQSVAICHVQMADSSCCQVAPALPAKAKIYAVASPAISFTTFGFASPGFASRFTRATGLTFLHSPPHCRLQATLCTFLI